jgi:SHS family lactate transporter-like MFS transporter
VLPFLALYVGMVPSLLWLGAFIGGALGAACTGVTPLLLTSLFPPDIRGRCVGIVYHVGAVLAAFTPTAMAMLTERGGFTFSQSIALMAGVCEVGMVAALFLRPRSARVEADAGSPTPALH